MEISRGRLHEILRPLLPVLLRNRHITDESAAPVSTHFQIALAVIGIRNRPGVVFEIAPHCILGLIEAGANVGISRMGVVPLVPHGGANQVVHYRHRLASPPMRYYELKPFLGIVQRFKMSARHIWNLHYNRRRFQ